VRRVQVKRERNEERERDLVMKVKHTRVSSVTRRKKPFLKYMVGARSVIICCFLVLVFLDLDLDRFK
jgi:hypothetical protein